MRGLVLGVLGAGLLVWAVHVGGLQVAMIVVFGILLGIVAGEWK